MEDRPRRSCSLSSTRCGTPCRRAAPRAPAGRRCHEPPPSPRALVGRGRRDPGGLAGRLARAADRGRPRLADPVLRSGLGRRPAGRAGPAAPGRGRGGGRHERLRLGPPRERRGARRRVRARRRSSSARSCWRSARWSSSPAPPSVAGAAPRGRPGPASSPRSGPTCPAWIIAAAVGLVVLVVLGSNGWRETPDGWVSRRLELERPAGPRRDRLEHRRPATSRRRSPTSPACR